MKLNKLRLALILALFRISAGVVAHAGSVDWNVKGAWDIGYEIQDGNYGLSFTISTENFATGMFSGLDDEGNPVMGMTSGSTIQFDDPVLGGYTDGVFTGVIAANGTMSGGMTAYNTHGQWSGFFYTISGAATPTPEPACLPLLASGLVAIGLALRRRTKTRISREACSA